MYIFIMWRKWTLHSYCSRKVSLCTFYYKTENSPHHIWCWLQNPITYNCTLLWMVMDSVIIALTDIILIDVHFYEHRVKRFIYTNNLNIHLPQKILWWQRFKHWNKKLNHMFILRIFWFQKKILVMKNHLRIYIFNQDPKCFWSSMNFFFPLKIWCNS